MDKEYEVWAGEEGVYKNVLSKEEIWSHLFSGTPIDREEELVILEEEAT